MTQVAIWYLLLGAVLISMGIFTSMMKSLPLTPSMLYYVIGVGLGGYGADLLNFDPIGGATTLEHLTEAGVVISLFSAGMKLRFSFRDLRWRLPLRLATASMVITIFLIAWVSVQWLGLSLGAGVLLGAVLAPTDPVLASDVQVRHAHDQDSLRINLTGEAGLNDGTAFPFVMLGLGLLGYHDLGSEGWRWFSIDLAWAIAGGCAIGFALGTLAAITVFWIRERGRESAGLDEFISLGLIGVAYGAALSAHAYGFLAVFFAALAFRWEERRRSENTSHETPAHTAKAVLHFNEQLERMVEAGMVILLGSMVSPRIFNWDALIFVPILLLVIRPLAVIVGTRGLGCTRLELALMSWFGIRGIGSLYYLAFAIAFGVGDSTAQKLIDIVLATVSVSIILHGLSVTPLLRLRRASSHA